MAYKKNPQKHHISMLDFEDRPLFETNATTCCKLISIVISNQFFCSNSLESKSVLCIHPIWNLRPMIAFRSLIPRRLLL